MNNQTHNPHEVNLLDMRRELDHAQDASGEGNAPLALAKVGSNPVPLVMFDYRAVSVPVHHLKSVQYRGFLRCTGTGCILCAAQYGKWTKVVFPVYNPLTRRVELLAVDDQRDPGSALAQILEILGNDPAEMVLLLMRQVNFNFTIMEKRMPPSMRPEPQVIDHFKAERERGLDLASIYPQMDNEQLMNVPEIAMLLELGNE